ncbi:hypothetical protein BFL38_12720 [Brachyspira hampsonii]|uniref:Uncharacterized protein n=1 Tax=Brachyspira hampsonii TaxID=1287055 RepID=A0A1E5NG78_9SPIR|nr:hypothetical protein BFL38_12720 [Brachyspira hampsonii]
MGITANSDIVTLYVEPSLGYTAAYDGKLTANAVGGPTDPKVKHSLAWGAYTELYIRPTQDLEWYFEMDVNNSCEVYYMPPNAKDGKDAIHGFVHGSQIKTRYN